MSSDLTGTLDAAVSEAAAALVFAEAVPVDGPPGPSDEPVVLELVAPERGWLTVRVVGGDPGALGKTAWGALADGSPDQEYLFLCEFANVIAGRLLADLHPDAEVKIGLPRRLGDTPLPPTVATRVYDLEGSRLAVEITGA